MEKVKLDNMGVESDTLLQETVHNISVSKKNGKRNILQIDFPSKRVNFIHRGVIKESYHFQQLRSVDSEEGSTISLTLDDKDVEIDIDNMEDKYVVCRLLSFVQDYNSDPGSSDVRLTSTDDEQKLETIKDGFLDKRGNVKIPVWSKRRVRISPGEFSYYRPKDKNALNVVQIKSETSHVTTNDADGFTITVRDRDYLFRLPKNGGKTASERTAERDTWLKAFAEALRSKRRTFIMLDPGISGSQWSLDSLDDLDPPMTPNSASYTEAQNTYEIPTYENTGRTNNSSASLAEEKATYEVPTVEESLHANGPTPLEISERPPSPTRNIAPVAKPRKSRPSTSSQSSVERLLPSPRIKQSGETTTVLSSSQDYTNTETYANEIQCSKPQQGPPKPPRQLNVDSAEHRDRVVESGDSRHKDCFDAKPLEVAEPVRAPPPPPPPPPTLTPPIPPPPVAPPLPETKNKRTMKPIHWSPVPRQLVQSSIWQNKKNMGSKLDLKMLEKEFSSIETASDSPAQASKKTKDILLDSKRARNLEISLSGMKMITATQLEEALNSLTEMEEFPAEKLCSLRRYQPTRDEFEMYKMYKGRREDLHPIDQFMLDVCKIPCFGARLDLVLIIWEFPKHFENVNEMVSQMIHACKEMMTSGEFVRILQYLLDIGNYMNTGAIIAETTGFQITSLDKKLKITEVRGKKRSYTILDYLLQQLRDVEPELIHWPETLSNVVKCNKCSIKAITAEIEVLRADLSKIKKNLKILKNMKHSNEEDKAFQKKAKAMALQFEVSLEKLILQRQQLQKAFIQVKERFGENTERTYDEFFGAVAKFVYKFNTARFATDSKG
ncbi:hypothetical protein ScPMuIL_001380 [Solemya velum]